MEMHVLLRPHPPPSHFSPKTMTNESKLVSSSDGTKIYADSNGNSSKPALVFIHGFMLAAGVFDSLFADERLAKEFHLVRLSVLFT